MSGGSLLCFLPPLPGHPGTSLSVSRQDGGRHQLRPSMPVPQKNQFKHLSGWSGGRHQEVDDGIWLVSFIDYDLGYIDLEEKTLQPLNSPFGPKVLPMS